MQVLGLEKRLGRKGMDGIKCCKSRCLYTLELHIVWITISDDSPLSPSLPGSVHAGAAQRNTVTYILNIVMNANNHMSISHYI